MKNAALKIDPHRASLREASPRVLDGAVARREGSGFVVRAEGLELRARRAVSCLVEPEPGDRVLLGDVGGGEIFVLAVLDRREGAPATITHDGDLSVRLDHGRYEVVAQEGVGVTSPKDVSVAAGAVDVRAVDGSVAVSRLSMVGRLVQAEVEKVKLFGESLDAVLERTSQRVKRAYRVVAEMDSLRAGAVDYAAKAVLRLHGKNTVVTSEEVVKVDANQIHMG